MLPWTRDGSLFWGGWQPGGDGHIRISSIRSALRPLRPFDPRDGLAEWPRTKREASRTTPATEGWVGRWAGRTGWRDESLRRSRTIGRGELRGEPHLVPPMRTPSPPPPPHARLSSSSFARHGSGDATAPRPFETHPLTPPSPVGRAHLFYLAQPATPSPPSLFSCDISDSVTPPTLRFTKPFFPHLANEKNT